MIEFEYKNKKYSLEWRYEGSQNNASKLSKKGQDNRIKTFCILKDGNRNILVEGYTIQHKGDNHCREIARKISLKKVLSLYDEIAGEGFEFRKTVWDSYNSRKQKSLMSLEDIEYIISILEELKIENKNVIDIYFEYA